MAKYRILATPLVWTTKGGKAIIHQRLSDSVDIDDDVAKELGDKVERVGGDPAPAPKPRKAEVKAEVVDGDES